MRGTGASIPTATITDTILTTASTAPGIHGTMTTTGTVLITGTAIIGDGMTTIGIIRIIITTIITIIMTTLAMEVSVAGADTITVAATTISPAMSPACVATTPLAP